MKQYKYAVTFPGIIKDATAVVTFNYEGQPVAVQSDYLNDEQRDYLASSIWEGNQPISCDDEDISYYRMDGGRSFIGYEHTVTPSDDVEESNICAICRTRDWSNDGEVEYLLVDAIIVGDFYGLRVFYSCVNECYYFQKIA